MQLYKLFQAALQNGKEIPNFGKSKKQIIVPCCVPEVLSHVSTSKRKSTFQFYGVIHYWLVRKRAVCLLSGSATILFSVPKITGASQFHFLCCRRLRIWISLSTGVYWSFLKFFAWMFDCSNLEFCVGDLWR